MAGERKDDLCMQVTGHKRTKIETGESAHGGNSRRSKPTNEKKPRREGQHGHQNKCHAIRHYENSIVNLIYYGPISFNCCIPLSTMSQLEFFMILYDRL